MAAHEAAFTACLTTPRVYVLAHSHTAASPVHEALPQGWPKALLRGVRRQPVSGRSEKIRAVHQGTTHRAVPALTELTRPRKTGNSFDRALLLSPPPAGVYLYRKEPVPFLRLAPHATTPIDSPCCAISVYKHVRLGAYLHLHLCLGAYLHAWDTRAASLLASPRACPMMIEVKTLPSSKLFRRISFRRVVDGSSVALMPWPRQQSSDQATTRIEGMVEERGAKTAILCF